MIITPAFLGAVGPLFYPGNNCFLRSSIQPQEPVKTVVQALAKEVNEAKDYLTTNLAGLASKFCILQQVSMASLFQLGFAYLPFTGE